MGGPELGSQSLSRMFLPLGAGAGAALKKTGAGAGAAPKKKQEPELEPPEFAGSPALLLSPKKGE